MRFFIALEIPDQNKTEIEVIQNKIKGLIPQAKLTPQNKLHLTLAFIGDHPTTFIEPLTDLLTTATKNITPFTISPNYIDGFPTLHLADVLWLGVKGDTEKLFVIEERLQDGLAKLGLTNDLRRFTPHITIAKLNDFQMTPTIEATLQTLSLTEHPDIQVNSIKLFESIPDQSFHTHRVLTEINLG